MTLTAAVLLGCGEPPSPVVVDLDLDGDGIGSADGDCNDADATVHPGAPDQAHDGIDSDCDGSDSSSEPVGPLPSMPSPIGEPEVLFGHGLSAGDVDGDGRSEVLIGCEDRDQGGGHAWLVSGPDLEVVADWHGAWVVDQPSLTILGNAVAMGDLTGDGHPDPIIHELNHMWVLNGQDLAPPSLQGAVVHVGTEGDFHLGVRVLAAPVASGSGVDLVAECADYGPATPTRAVCVLRGPLTTDRDLAESDVVLLGEWLGTSLAAPDLDGDGEKDLAVGADPVDAEAGAMHLFLGPLSDGSFTTSDAEQTFHGEGPGDWLGQRAADVGDIDADGLDDLAVTALGWPAHDARGRVYLLPLGLGDIATAPLIVDGEEGAWLGGAIASGDFDGDGQADLVLGAPSTYGPLPGRASLFYGPIAGHRSAADADRAWAGEHPGDEFGHALVRADVDGNGYDDLVVAARRYEHGDDQGVGKIYLLLGPLDD